VLSVCAGIVNVATVFGPVVYGPQPVMVYKRTDDPVTVRALRSAYRCLVAVLIAVSW
jgi:hypothetical protein